MKHYVTVVESDYEKATNFRAVQRVVHHRAESTGNQNPKNPNNLEKDSLKLFFRWSVKRTQYA